MNCFCCCEGEDDWAWDADLTQRRVCCYRSTCTVCHCAVGFCVPPVNKKGQCSCKTSWIWFAIFSPIFVALWVFSLVLAAGVFIFETLACVPYRSFCNRPDPICGARIQTVADRLARNRLFPERPMQCMDWIYPGGDRRIDLESATSEQAL